jgi:hypothetical protein
MELSGPRLCEQEARQRNSRTRDAIMKALNRFEGGAVLCELAALLPRMVQNFSFMVLKVFLDFQNLKFARIFSLNPEHFVRH